MAFTTNTSKYLLKKGQTESAIKTLKKELLEADNKISNKDRWIEQMNSIQKEVQKILPFNETDTNPETLDTGSKINLVKANSSLVKIITEIESELSIIDSKESQIKKNFEEASNTHKEIFCTLYINKNFDTFTQNDQNEIISIITEVTSLTTDEIIVIEKTKGSVKLKLQLPILKCFELHLLVNLGAFLPFGIELSKVGLDKSKVASSSNSNHDDYTLSDIFLISAGVDRSIMKLCSEKERTKYISLGFIVIFTASVAGLSMGYAIYTTTYNIYASIVLGTLWSSFIYSFDRLMMSSIRRKTDDKWTDSLSRGGARLILAIVLGYIVSIPVEVYIMDSIVTPYSKEEDFFKAQKRREYNQTSSSLSSYGQREGFLSNNRDKLQLERDNPTESSAYKSVENARDNVTNRIAQLERELENKRVYRNRLTSCSGSDVQKYCIRKEVYVLEGNNYDKNSQVDMNKFFKKLNGRSHQVAGVTSSVKTVNNQRGKNVVSSLNNDIRSLRSNIRLANNELIKLNSELVNTEKAIVKKADSSLVVIDQEIIKTVDKKIEISNELDSQEKQDLKEFESASRKFLKKYFTLERMKEDENFSLNNDKYDSVDSLGNEISLVKEVRDSLDDALAKLDSIQGVEVELENYAFEQGREFDFEVIRKYTNRLLIQDVNTDSMQIDLLNDLQDEDYTTAVYQLVRHTDYAGSILSPTGKIDNSNVDIDLQITELNNQDSFKENSLLKRIGRLLSLLFILIEASPVLMKIFMPRSQYDREEEKAGI